VAIEIKNETRTAFAQALHEKLSRRTLVKGTGAAAAAGLTVSWASPLVRAQEASPAAEPALPSASPLVDNYNPSPPFGFLQSPQEADAYLSIDSEGNVTLRTSLVDFGQGIETGFIQIVAEELGVAFENVRTITGETDQVPFNIGTFGSLSTQTTGPILRGAAATLREWLIDLGAEKLGVSRDQLTAQGSQVFVTADPTKTVSYAALAGGQASGKSIEQDVPLKDPNTYTIVGQPIPRIQAKEKSTGRQKYGIDAHIDGQIYAKIVRPPALGAKLQDIDFSAAEATPGYIGSFRDGDFAAIVAERYEQAEVAVAAVKATWSTVSTGNTSDNIHELLKSTADAGQLLGEQPEEGATPVPTPEPAEIVKPLSLTFKDQYVNHAPIEPKNALVNVTADRVDVWTSTQSPFNVRAAVAQQLGRDPETVVVHHLTSGGAFGSKILPNAEMPAAVLSNHFGKPVKLIFRRDEEFQFGQFRPAMLVEVNTGLAADNTIASWTYNAYTAGYYPETAEEATGSASDWGADVTEIYGVPAATSTLFNGHSPLPPYFWRVNGASTNAFAREVTLTQLAELAGQDPVTFRKSLLGNNPRMAAVLDALVAQAGWTPGVGSTGQGIGLALAFDGNSYIGQIANVSVDTSTGALTINRFDAVMDCGLIVNPEGVRHQVEGSIVLSLSPTLKEAITFDNGKVTNASFAQYAPLNITEAPRHIEVGFVEDKNNPMGGVGEPAVAPVPAAVVSAIYDATGVWIYEIPLTPDRVLAALQAAGKATAPAATPAAQ
jgi:isoquinoline 1-oxidoreductase